MSDGLFFGIASILYIVAKVFYIIYIFQRTGIIGSIASYIVYCGFGLHTFGFIIRWYDLATSFSLPFFQSIPITNLYESLLFFAWCIILGNIFIESYFKTKIFGFFNTALAGMSIAFIDAIGANKLVQPILPALKSNWLLAHATLSFIAYAIFSLAFVSSIFNIIVNVEKRWSKIYIFWVLSLSIFIYTTFILIGDFILNRFVKSESGYKPLIAYKNIDDSILLLILMGFVILLIFIYFWGINVKKVIDKFQITTDILETVEYKLITIGFSIFTIGGLIFGAIWADISWGRYWAWDPKETWAFITWLTYAVYLHMRYLKGYEGVRTSIVSVVGFLITIFTYVGVNLLLSGLHSYGSM
ncbi:MAG: c-type cytochrome biogenesis protein CcsB [Deferribacterales bacterium]